MANETPYHEYREVGDDPIELKGCSETIGCIMSGIVLLISIPFIVLTIISFCCDWEVMRWVLLALSLIIVLFGIYLGLDDDKSSIDYDKTSPRLREAQRAKSFLGYDFGDNFKLRTTGSHDYSEILLDFEEDTFRPLCEFCKSQKACKTQTSTPDEIAITEIKHHILVKEKVFEFEEELTKTGFTKTTRFYDSSLSKENDLWIKYELQCEVDYENMTLKMFYAGGKILKCQYSRKSHCNAVNLKPKAKILVTDCYSGGVLPQLGEPTSTM